ncbi:hypothetical protein [Actinoplanes friuliensis]|uniref:DUF3137 domain-containing protein n=1 Tax=Actinoplanes friuliensis DSM 7358 TaxID=1246995 RepID=U5VVF3_9ACTN|nr:hypothetical protein [Actinoplanes friuliensis]AGZ40787.1 hypothetical protein AFR_12505 [Actinoplanes friuliensis DSM 7358]
MSYGALTVVGMATVVLLIVVLVVLYERSKQQRQRRELEGWAEQSGWTLTPKPREGWVRWLPRRVGGRPKVRNLVTGMVDGRRVSVGQYYALENDTWEPWIGVCAELRVALPTTTVWRVSPIGVLSPADRKTLGSTETELGHDEFDRRFRISTRQPETLQQWFGPHLTDAHLAGQMPTLWSVHDREVVVQMEGRLVPEEIAGLAAAVLPLVVLLEGSPSLSAD